MSMRGPARRLDLMELRPDGDLWYGGSQRSFKKGNRLDHTSAGHVLVAAAVWEREGYLPAVGQSFARGGQERWTASVTELPYLPSVSSRPHSVREGWMGTLGDMSGENPRFLICGKRPCGGRARAGRRVAEHASGTFFRRKRRGESKGLWSLWA